MVTARHDGVYGSRGATALAARPQRKIAPATPQTLPVSRPMPRSRRREYQAWITLLIAASLLFLALGIFSLYGRICQTKEINRRSSLNAMLKQARHHQQELNLKINQIEADRVIAAEAAKRNMIRPTDKDALTIP